MSPEQIRIMVAEEQGWKFSKIKGSFEYSIQAPDGRIFQAAFGDLSHLPNYVTSRDACAEFEEALDQNEGARYAHFLLNELGIPDLAIDDCYTGNELRQLICAAPLKRCQAFLKMRNKI